MHSKGKTTSSSSSSSSSSLPIKEHRSTRNNLTNNKNNINHGTNTLHFTNNKKSSGGSIKYDADLILSDPYNIISEPSVICRKEGDSADVVEVIASSYILI
jgi:hypothetical protein